MTFLLIASVFTVWRLTYMLVEETGPKQIFARLRGKFISQATLPVKRPDGLAEYQVVTMPINIVGEILECFYCCSVWTAFPVAVYLAYLTDLRYLPLLWLGLSGSAIQVEVIRRKLENE